MKTLKPSITVLCLGLALVGCSRHTLEHENRAPASYMNMPSIGKLITSLKMPSNITMAQPEVSEERARITIKNKMEEVVGAASALENIEVSNALDRNSCKALRITFDNETTFDDKAELRSEAKSRMKELADKLLKRFANCDVAICSFTNTQGKADANLAQSQRRADAVKAFLTGTCGIDASRITHTTGYGSTSEYLIRENGKEDNKKSQRTEIYLYAGKKMILDTKK
ncbi:MAG: OmpA family protein [Bacteroidales bacterium]|nr:OmpA family protein [Bacteroidales bacterium]